METKKNKKIYLRCPYCKSHQLNFDEDETYCRNCGLVIQGVPSMDQYPYGYILGSKRIMYVTEEEMKHIEKNF